MKLPFKSWLLAQRVCNPISYHHCDTLWYHHCDTHCDTHCDSVVWLLALFQNKNLKNKTGDALASPTNPPPPRSLKLMLPYWGGGVLLPALSFLWSFLPYDGLSFGEGWSGFPTWPGIRQTEKNKALLSLILHTRSVIIINRNIDILQIELILLIQNLEDKERKHRSAKDQLAREQRYLRRRLEQLTDGQYRLRVERSISECSSSTSFTLSSSSSSATSEPGDDASAEYGKYQNGFKYNVLTALTFTELDTLGPMFRFTASPQFLFCVILCRLLHVIDETMFHLALARWPMASKYCLGPVNFSLTGPAWLVKNLDNIWPFFPNF